MTCPICNKEKCEVKDCPYQGTAHESEYCHHPLPDLGHPTQEKECVCSCHDPNSCGESKKKHCHFCPTSPAKPEGERHVLVARCGCGEDVFSDDGCDTECSNCNGIIEAKYFKVVEIANVTKEVVSRSPAKPQGGKEGWEERFNTINYSDCESDHCCGKCADTCGRHRHRYVVSASQEEMRRFIRQVEQEAYSRGLSDMAAAGREAIEKAAKEGGACPPNDHAHDCGCWGYGESLTALDQAAKNLSERV